MVVTRFSRPQDQTKENGHTHTACGRFKFQIGSVLAAFWFGGLNNVCSAFLCVSDFFLGFFDHNVSRIACCALCSVCGRSNDPTSSSSNRPISRACDGTGGIARKRRSASSSRCSCVYGIRCYICCSIGRMASSISGSLNSVTCSFCGC